MLWEFKEEKNKADWNCTGGEEEELYLLLLFLLEKQRQPSNKNAPPQLVQSGLSAKFQELKEDRVLDEVKESIVNPPPRLFYQGNKGKRRSILQRRMKSISNPCFFNTAKYFWVKFVLFPPILTPLSLKMHFLVLHGTHTHCREIRIYTNTKVKI